MRCDECGQRTETAGASWRCACGGPFSLEPSGMFPPAALNSRGHDMWRYREAMGFDEAADPVSLGEGFTPLLCVQIEGLACLLKMELLNPTGSFKDRGASAVMTRLRQLGVSLAIEDSSGNAGVAMAAYGAHAGITMEIVVPGDAPRPKLAAIEACGARLVRVPGGRQAASEEALRRASTGIAFASHVWDPFFNAGTRSFAFEVWEQTRRRVPPRIFFPVGNGSLLIGSWEGFEQLRNASLIDGIPRLVSVQAEVPGMTIADGIRITAPPRARGIHKAVDLSGGEILKVTDEEIRDARLVLGRHGLYVEPTAAVGFAGALKWGRSPAAAREISREGPPLIPLTGSGLKVAA